MKNTVGIVVTYNTPQLIRNAISSIRRFYKDLPILIIDGSPEGSHCYLEVERLKRFGMVDVRHETSNIGHGRGLHLGISMTKQENILVFDSDIVMKRPCLELMQFKLLHPLVYGIGQIVRVDMTGHNHPNGMEYLHPHFAMISRRHYNNFNPFIHHGAPFIKAAHSLYSQQLVQMLDFPVKKYVKHVERGTVNMLRKGVPAKPQKVSTPVTRRTSARPSISARRAGS